MDHGKPAPTVFVSLTPGAVSWQTPWERAIPVRIDHPTVGAGEHTPVVEGAAGGGGTGDLYARSRPR
jgi:hypothetical protein